MEQKLIPAVSVQHSLEVQVLDKVNTVESMIREMNIKFFGDAATESEKGRFPMVEAAVKDLAGRVTKLERLVWLATGGGFVIGFFLHLLVK